MMNIEEIKATIPHRYPFLLVDRVLEMTPTSIVAIKNVTANEEFFNGHFPGNPIMPGVLQVEALAQAGCIGFLKMNDLSAEEYTVVFSAINNCKFRRPVVPGDQLRLEVTITGVKRMFITMHSKASVDGQVTCELDAIAALIPNKK
jgi:3-hydroxyacyl-[acyl-carrier-protein] dehydratase